MLIVFRELPGISSEIIKPLFARLTATIFSFAYLGWTLEVLIT